MILFLAMKNGVRFLFCLVKYCATAFFLELTRLLFGSLLLCSTENHEVNLTRRNKNKGWTISRFRNVYTASATHCADGFTIWRLVDGRFLNNYKCVLISDSQIMMTEPEDLVIILADHEDYLKQRKKMAHYEKYRHQEIATDLNDLEDEAADDPGLLERHTLFKFPNHKIGNLLNANPASKVFSPQVTFWRKVRDAKRKDGSKQDLSNTYWLLEYHITVGKLHKAKRVQTETDDIGLDVIAGMSISTPTAS